MLITGSTGCGKTQGSILPYFRQLIHNFDLPPAILAIDPKRTFVDRALKIIETSEKERVVRLLQLGGRETYNPVYVPNVLKKSRFMTIADNIKTASANLAGSNVENQFWELSSFNLVKNIIVHSAAILEYYTLKDLYDTVVRATKCDLGEELKSIVKTKKFDAEELYNIERSIQYFEYEYKQLDEKVRSGILATTTAFLNQFMEFQASQIFCPPKDGITIHNMDSVIDEGEIVLVDIDNHALAKSMGTFLKLAYEQSVLNRLSNKNRPLKRMAAVVIDEFQDVVTYSGGNTLGDEKFLGKCRESKALFIAATQSLTSLYSSAPRDKNAMELIQNFRTRITMHSSDEATIRNIKELVGQHKIEKVSHSFSESSHKAHRNLVLGGIESDNSNVSESISVSEHKEFTVTGKELNELEAFEAYTFIFSGKKAVFAKIFLKPDFLENKATLHNDLMAQMDAKDNSLAFKSACAVMAALFIGPKISYGFPTVCSVMNSMGSNSCINFQVEPDMCGSPIPRPCARISYRVPRVFLETSSAKGNSYFSGYPGASAQLASIPKTSYGAVFDDDSQALQARAITVPFTEILFRLLPCGGTRMVKLCFDAMSEHFGMKWNTGSGDSLQPKFIAWSLKPELCLLKGAAGNFTGSKVSTGNDSPMCSVPLDTLPKYPPSQMSVCTPWGVMFPRGGVYTGPSEIGGSLAVASRIKSLGAEVMNSTPSGQGEKWQMIQPNSSSCFNEFENLALLENLKGANNRERMVGKSIRSNLFVTWKRVSCTVDWPSVPVYYANLNIIKSVCAGMK